MRLRALELVRYGGYADRVLDFGEADCDFHLVVGPNEAGKSTLLSAIGDLLFGFPGQTSQDWRFGYQELRIRAELEHSGGQLSVVRRKGNKNTLLRPDGTALPDDTLAPLLGPLDRPAFERMFGLDHAKLRAGGHAMLEGRDNAARTLFEAGTGLAAAGAELRRLEAQAQALFKPGGSNPIVNQLLRERQDALKRVREATLNDAELAEIKTHEAEAERRRAELVEEAKTITSKLGALERLARTRAPLQRHAAATADLAALGPTPDLPADAQRCLDDARARRSTAQEALAASRDEQSQAQTILDASPLPASILSERARIEGLEERRPAVEKAENDLLRRRPELEESDRRLTLLRTAAGLVPNAALPPDHWRRRLGEHLEVHRRLEARVRKLGVDEAELAHERHELEANRDHTGVAPDVRDLRSVLDAVAGDVEERLQTTRRDYLDKARRAVQSRAALDWAGDVDALAALALPSREEVRQLLAEMDAAKKATAAAWERHERAAVEIATQRRRMAELAAGGDLPTADAVAAARAERGEMLGEVLQRLQSDRTPGDGEAGLRLAESVVRADALADRRQSEASRVAEHALACIAHAEAKAEATAARPAIDRHTRTVGQLELAWSERSTVIGLPASLALVGLESWRGARERALQDAAAAEMAERQADQLQTAFDGAYAQLGAALEAAGFEAPQGFGPRRLEGRRALERIEKAVQAEGQYRVKDEALKRRSLALSREEEAIRTERTHLDAERQQLGAEGGLLRTEPEALTLALDQLDQAAQEAVRRVGFARQVDAMEHDVKAFDHEVGLLLQDLDRPPAERASGTMRGLAVELRAGLERSRDVQSASDRLARANAAAAAARRALDSAEVDIATLIAQAEVSEEVQLEPVIAAAKRAADLVTRRDQALKDLHDAGEGQTVERLQRAADDLAPDAAASEREALLARRAELDSERENVGRDLAKARAALDEAASSLDAADAQQVVADTQAALRGAAERHLEAAGQAALLRWVIERHRATSQAPLLARAGGLFATATQNAFSGLSFDYDDSDQAQIVAVRTDGDRTPVHGLSEGTRDQLYLSLRLASLLSAAQPSQPPLICDDLLSTSDDHRAAAIMRTLRDAAGQLQVLVFTHHEHLVEVATKALGAERFRLHRLSPVTAAPSR